MITIIINHYYPNKIETCIQSCIEAVNTPLFESKFWGKNGEAGKNGTDKNGKRGGTEKRNE